MPYSNQIIEDEKLLVEMAAKGNKEAFSKLFFNYKEMVYRVIYRLMGNSDYIDDAVQQTFIEIYKSLPGFESKSKFTTWIYRIAVNVSIQFLRKRRPHEKTPSIDPDDIEDTFSSVKEQDSRETIKIIKLALKAINLKKRTVVVLHDIEGRTMEEISEIVGIPLGTVKSRLFHGREDLKRKLENLLEQP
jgi:RNA polymerase sigma-70 factor (ECF subfamily)